MSYTIEYRNLALRLNRALGWEVIRKLCPQIQEDWYADYAHQEPTTLVFIESGESNTLNRDGSIAKNWSLKFGSTDPIGAVIERAGYAERELLRVRGRSMLAENYIKLYRSALASSRDLSEVKTPMPAFVAVLAQRFSSEIAGQEHYRARVTEHPFTEFVMTSGLAKYEVLRDYRGNEQTSLCLAVPAGSDPLWLPLMTWLFTVTGGYDGSDRSGFSMDWKRSYGFGQWCENVLAEAALAAA